MKKNNSEPMALKHAKDVFILLVFFLIILLNSACTTLSRNKNKGEYTLPESTSEKEIKSPEAFIHYDHNPEFPGGNAAMMKFISDSLRYPLTAMGSGIQGRVILNFTINEDGTLSDIQVIRGVDTELDTEAIGLVKSMPKWKPGEGGGEKIKRKFTLPIVFKLDKSKASREH